MANDVQKMSKFDDYIVFVGQIIAYLRQGLNWTLKDLAEHSGLSVSYLSAIENGKKTPDLRVMARIADALNVPLARIIDAADNMEQERAKIASEFMPLFQRMSIIYKNINDSRNNEGGDESDNLHEHGGKVPISGGIGNAWKLQRELY